MKRHVGLDLLRALAIVQTFFVHFAWVIGGWLFQRDVEKLAVRDAQSLTEGAVIWLAHSQHGVFLFFVLSGYLMGRKWFTAAHVPTLDFLRDRAWRTLPGAWAALLASLLLLWSAGKLPADPVLRFLENAFFLNWFRSEDSRVLLVVTWSLHAEWLFYLSLPLVAWWAKRAFAASPALGVFIAALAIMVVLKFLSHRGWAYAWFFAVGVIVAIKRDDWRAYVDRVSWPFVISIYVAVNSLYAWFSPSAAVLQRAMWNAFDTHALFFGVTAGFLLLKTVYATLIESAWVMLGSYIGKISYSIYLWHLLVIIAVGQYLRWPGTLEHLGRPLAFAIYAAATVVLTWLISALSFALIEQPYFNRRRAQSPVKSSEIRN